MPVENERKRVVLDGTDAITDNVWWDKTKEVVGRVMVAVAQKYETAQEPRREQSRRYVQLHKGQLMGSSMLDAARPRDMWEDIHPAWNVIQAGTNTAQSVVTRNRVRVTFQTNGADYELQEAAKMAELWVSGCFAGNKLYEELDPLWFLDAAVPGLGILIVEPDESLKTIIDRVIPDELIFSDVEAVKGKPRQMFRIQWMSKWQAVAEYGDTPEKVEAINAITAYEYRLPGMQTDHIPLVPIYTAWFLPTKRGADDGRRVVGIPGTSDGCTLRDRTWKWPRFPLAFYRIERSPAGLWGIGIAERLAGFQYRLNELNYLIEEAARLGSLGKWLVDSGSSVNPAELNNEQAGIVNYTSKEPKFVSIDGIPKDLLQERDTTYAQALKEIGLSEWTTGGVQPANIESGEGLAQLREQEQGRALPAGQGWESAHVDVAELCVMAGLDAWEIYQEKKKAAKKGEKLDVEPPAQWVVDPDGDGLVQVEFEKIAEFLNDPDQWLCRPYPTSILPSSPTWRFEKLREWKADGTIDNATFVALSDMPDIHQETSLQLAGIKAVRHAISNIVNKGEAGYEPPDPAMPLELAHKIAHNVYLRGLRQGMPENKLALLLSWMEDVEQLQNPEPPSPGTDPNAPPPVGEPPTEAPPTGEPPIEAPPVDPTGAPPIEAPPEVAPVDPNAPPVAGDMGGDMAANAAAAPVGV